MKTLKRLTLVAIIALTNLVGFSNGNSNNNANTLTVANEFACDCGYTNGHHYNYRGNSSIETIYRSEYDSYSGRTVQVRYQRQLNWFQASKTAYGMYGPYTSYYWTCTWSAFVRG